MKYIYLVFLLMIFGLMMGCNNTPEQTETPAPKTNAGAADTQGNKPMTRPGVGKPE
jgi:hypothetical protein